MVIDLKDYLSDQDIQILNQMVNSIKEQLKKGDYGNLSFEVSDLGLRIMTSDETHLTVDQVENKIYFNSFKQ